MRLRIECLSLSNAVVSLYALKAAALWRLERENRKRERLGQPPLSTEESSLLNQSIRRLGDRGWVLKTVHNDSFVFEGPGTLDLRTRDPRAKAEKRGSSKS